MSLGSRPPPLAASPLLRYGRGWLGWRQVVRCSRSERLQARKGVTSQFLSAAARHPSPISMILTTGRCDSQYRSL